MISLFLVFRFIPIYSLISGFLHLSSRKPFLFVPSYWERSFISSPFGFKLRYSPRFCLAPSKSAWESSSRRTIPPVQAVRLCSPCLPWRGPLPLRFPPPPATAFCTGRTRRPKIHQHRLTGAHDLSLKIILSDRYNWHENPPSFFLFGLSYVKASKTYVIKLQCRKIIRILLTYAQNSAMV